MLKIFKNKNFWFSVAHIAVAGGSVALSVMFPAAIPAIIPGQALLNGLIPSPLVSSVSGLPSVQIPKPINLQLGDQVALKEKLN